MSSVPTGTIVLADDDDDFRRVIEEAFADEPFHLVLARDSREALEAVELEQPDLVFLQAGLPVDGFAVCRELKSREGTRSVPVVLVCSGSECEEEILRGFEQGADDLIRKPMTVAYLKTKIRVWMARGNRG